MRSARHHIVSIAFALTICIGSDANAQMEATAELYLKEMRTIGYEINIRARSVCEVNEEKIKAEIINRFVPAGLIIGDNYNPYLNVSITSIAVTDYICAANVILTLCAFDEIDGGNSRRHMAIVLAWHRGSLISASRGGFENHLHSTLRDHLDIFLARWRAVNAGADFVRQMPPSLSSNTSNATPNIKVVQQRLQALGLYGGVLDGIAGSGTRQAIQAFQRSQQLPATGDLDLETMRKMFP